MYCIDFVCGSACSADPCVMPRVLCVPQDRDTPLHCAAAHGHTATAGLLLDRGANTEAVNNVSDDSRSKTCGRVVLSASISCSGGRKPVDYAILCTCMNR